MTGNVARPVLEHVGAVEAPRTIATMRHLLPLAFALAACGSAAPSPNTPPLDGATDAPTSTDVVPVDVVPSADVESTDAAPDREPVDAPQVDAAADASTCADPMNDPMNCGACGNRCAFPNAAATCARGLCGLGACARGFADCNGANDDGCETNTNENAHCGTCRTRCPGASRCVGGVCEGACSVAGQTFCDGSCRSLDADRENCGACGNACPMVSGRLCFHGTCETQATILPPYRRCTLMEGGTCPAHTACATAPLPTSPRSCTATCRSDSDCPGPGGVCLPSSTSPRWCARRCSRAGAPDQCADLGPDMGCNGYAGDVWACTPAL